MSSKNDLEESKEFVDGNSDDENAKNTQSIKLETGKDNVRVDEDRLRFESALKLYKLLLNVDDTSSTSTKKSKSINENNKLTLVKELIEFGIDPGGFDILISNELNRRLKERFGKIFLWLTVGFTLISYALIVFDAICELGISDIAITALIIEIPIQFIGLLYIIARNLFPKNDEVNNSIQNIDFAKFRNQVEITNPN